MHAETNGGVVRRITRKQIGRVNFLSEQEVGSVVFGFLLGPCRSLAEDGRHYRTRLPLPFRLWLKRCELYPTLCVDVAELSTQRQATSYNVHGSGFIIHHIIYSHV